MTDQGISAEGDSHTVPGEIIGSDLLLQLQLDLGDKMSIMTDFICPGPGIVAGFQEKKRLVLKEFQRNRRNAGIQMPAAADIGSSQGIIADRLIGSKMRGNGQQKVLFAKEPFPVNIRIHGLIVNQKVQTSGKELLGQCRGVGFHEVDMDMRILFAEAGQKRRKHIRGKEVGSADSQGAASHILHILYIILKAVFDIHDDLNGTDIFLPQIGQLNRRGAAVKNRKADALFHLFNSST